MMNEDVLKYVQDSVLCWLATADEDGFPNVSPKEIFCAHGDRSLLIANIASPGSLYNIKANPRVCVSFIDVFVQKGYKLKGMARAIGRGDPEFPVLAEPLAHMAGERFPFATLFAIEVTSVEPVVAPSYRFFPDTEESVQVASALRTYGVQAGTR